MSKEAMKLALESLNNSVDLVVEDAYNAEKLYGNYPSRQAKVGGLKVLAENHKQAIKALEEALANHYEDNLDMVKQEQGEPVAWISVKDELPKAMRGVSYKASLTDTVLVLHSDRPDYPITAHAVVGEGLGAGVAIPTDGASEHPEIAWYSASCNLNNPFNLKNDDYERFLPKIFGKKITHWMPIPTTPQQRKPLTDEQIDALWHDDTSCDMPDELKQFKHTARAIEAAHGIKE